MIWRRKCFSRSTAASRIFAATHGSRPGSSASSRTSAQGARARRLSDVSLDQDDASGRRYEPGAADAAFGDFELRDRLDKAIAQLPEPQRLLIAAHYLNGVQYEALAEAMNIPLGTVKTHLYRAKKRLRELLDT